MTETVQRGRGGKGVGAGCVLGRWPRRSVMMAEVVGDVEWWLHLNTCSCYLVPPTITPTVRPDISATPSNSNHQSWFDSCAVEPVRVRSVCPICRPSIICYLTLFSNCIDLDLWSIFFPFDDLLLNVAVNCSLSHRTFKGKLSGSLRLLIIYTI